MSIADNVHYVNSPFCRHDDRFSGMSMTAIDMSGPGIVVFDIDGVLADGRHREHFLASRPKDWVSFFALLGDDGPIVRGIERLQSMRVVHDCVLLSGRPERTRAATHEWLVAQGIGELPVYLRPDHDYRPAPEFKAEVLAALGGPSMVSLVIDDDEHVVDALKAAGYQVEHFTDKPRRVGQPASPAT